MKVYQLLTYLLTLALTSQIIALPLFSTIQLARLALRQSGNANTASRVGALEEIPVSAEPDVWGSAPTAMTPEEEESIC